MNKKGFKTIVSIAALFALVLIFLIFLFLFEKSSLTTTSDNFATIDSDYILGSVLRSSPAKAAPQGYALGSDVTVADFLSESCQQNPELFRVAIGKLEQYFESIYEKKWSLTIEYFSGGGLVEKKTYGHAVTRPVAFRVLPCKQKDSLMMITLNLPLGQKHTLQTFQFKRSS